MRLLLSAFMLAIISSLAIAQPEARLLRFPAIHGDQIVFSYAGDLYTVSSAGGVARKLTSDIGYEMFPRFSPDGKTLAFTGQYDGNTEVYTIPAEGGIPKRITFTATLDRDDVSDRMGPNNITMCWKDNNHVVYRSRSIEFNDFKGQLFIAPTDGGESVEIPLPRGGFCSFSPDGKRMAYNRVFREFRTWKRYRGGQADDIWIYDFETKQTTDVTNNPAQDIIPMWVGNTIYFASDRDTLKKMNLYAVDLSTGTTTKCTDFKEFDVKFPSSDGHSIVFENGGFIYRYDIASGNTEKVSIKIMDDMDVGRDKLIDVSHSIDEATIASDGARALFVARGDIFSVPAKNGPTQNLTKTPGIHERSIMWSPDGKYIAFISDRTGEDEIWMLPNSPNATPMQLTNGGDTYKFDLLWSPDSKKLAWYDRENRLSFVNIDSRAVMLVEQSKINPIRDFNWSPDSRWIAFTRPEDTCMPTIQIYSVESRQTIPVTDGWFASGNPTFSQNGEFLYFVSSRTFQPSYSQVEWNYSYQDMSKVYFVTLKASTKSPFEPKNDEVKVKASSEPVAGKDKSSKSEPASGTPAVSIDQTGLQSRIAVLPVKASNYGIIKSVGSKLYYRRGGRGEPYKVYVYDFDSQKESEVGEFGRFEISADNKKALVSQEGTYAIVDLPSGKLEVHDRLKLSDLKVTLDRKAEWTEIFNECWRQMRDFFYDPTMHHVDWQLMKQRYSQLLPYVNHRADLTYVIGEMIAELNAGHLYVGGGDMPRADRIPMGLLGAKIEKQENGFFKILKILPGQNWDPAVRSPLTEIGVNVREGEYITAVDGTPATEIHNLGEALINTAGKQVSLSINRDPKAEGSRTVTVIPTADEHELYYYNWVQENIEKVTKATNGKVGYIHVPDMGVPGLNEFVKHYYPQLRKEAVIIDVRGNGGGNVSPMIIERLRREIAMIDISRNGSPEIDPSGTIMGPKVLLTDEFSASDGDIVAYRFRKYNLGPIIGKRTWGGVVGISGTLPLLDGGFLNKPEHSRYDTGGTEWIMEGHGVDPDIVVDNDPAQEFAGNDQQLTKAISVIQDLMKTHPVSLPPHPPYKDKSH